MRTSNGIVIALGTILVLILAGVLLIGWMALMNDQRTSTTNSLTSGDESESPPVDQGNNENVKTIGARIAAQMETARTKISFLWSYNNTWTNDNLTNIYGVYVDALLVGMSETSNQSTIAVIHEPLAESGSIDLDKVTMILVSFEDLIDDLNETSVVNFQDVFPPTFMVDMALDDNTSLSLVFSAEHKVLGVVNGTWKQSSFERWGVEFPVFTLDSAPVFFTLTDSQVSRVLSIIQNFEALITATVPP